MTDLVIERVSKGLCPVCNKSLEEGEIEFVEYKETKQPVHKIHIKYE